MDWPSIAVVVAAGLVAHGILEFVGLFVAIAGKGWGLGPCNVPRLLRGVWGWLVALACIVSTPTCAIAVWMVLVLWVSFGWLEGILVSAAIWSCGIRIGRLAFRRVFSLEIACVARFQIGYLYKRAMEECRHGQAPEHLRDTDPEHIGLWRALAEYRTVMDRPLRPLRNAGHHVRLWLELVPFWALPAPDSIQALQEYVTYLEIPRQADLALLRAALARGVQAAQGQPDKAPILREAVSQGFAWTKLISSEILKS